MATGNNLKPVKGIIKYTPKPRTIPYPKTVKVDAAAWGIRPEHASAYDGGGTYVHRSNWIKNSSRASAPSAAPSSAPLRNALPDMSADGTYTIGRGDDCDAVIPPDETVRGLFDPRHQMLSRQHLEVRIENGMTHLKQLGFYPTAIRVQPHSGAEAEYQWRHLFRGAEIFLAQETYELLFWQWSNPYMLEVRGGNAGGRSMDPLFSEEPLRQEVVNTLVDLAAAKELIRRGDTTPLFIVDNDIDFSGEGGTSCILSRYAAPTSDNLLSVVKRAREVIKSGDITDFALVKSAAQELAAEPDWHHGLRIFGLTG